MPAIAWLFIGGAILTGGDIVFKYWIVQPSPKLYLVGLLLYLLGGMCLVTSFRSQNIAIASAIFVLCNIATLILVSWLVFHEMPSARKLTGLGLAGMSILLMT